MSTEIAEPKWDASNPRAIVHKKILDTARERPDASIEELAATVKGASADLVERVLDEYGDPGNDSQESSLSAPVFETEPETETEIATETATESEADTGTVSETATDTETVSETATDTETTNDPETDTETVTSAGAESENPDGPTADEPDEEADPSTPERAMRDTTAVDYRPDDAQPRDGLSEKQLAALRAIYDDPSASQRDLADQLGVTQSTINHRLNTITGFDWSARTEFVRDMFDSNNENGTTRNESVETIARRLDELSEQVETMTTQERASSAVGSLSEDPDLVCKVLRACIASEGISEDEEDRIIKAFVSSC